MNNINSLPNEALREFANKLSEDCLPNAVGWYSYADYHDTPPRDPIPITNELNICVFSPTTKRTLIVFPFKREKTGEWGHIQAHVAITMNRHSTQYRIAQDRRKKANKQTTQYRTDQDQT